MWLHFLLILSQPVFAFTALSCVLSGEAANTNFIIFGLAMFELTIYHTQCELATHYTTDVVIQSTTLNVS